jgi:hypothetical protein
MVPHDITRLHGKRRIINPVVTSDRPGRNQLAQEGIHARQITESLQNLTVTQAS